MVDSIDRKGPGCRKAIRIPLTSILAGLWGVIAIAGFTLLTFGADWLHESLGFPPGPANIAKLLLILVTVGVGLFWLTFFSPFRKRFLMGSLVVVALVLFFSLFRVVVDGDVGFNRIESRFAKRSFDSPDHANASVDLTSHSESDFDQFLGKRRDSTVRDVELNPDWNGHPPRLIWRQPIGEGWSGFAAVNGFAVTQEQRGQDECVTCYDIRTGRLMWIYSAPRRLEDTLSLGKVGPRATPTIDQGRVYTMGGTGILDCIDGSDGQLIWSRNIPEMLGIQMLSKTNSKGFEYQYEDSSLAWGRSGSPLIYGDKVIVCGGGPRNGKFSTLMAFDKSTGDEVWRGGDKMISYGSPSITKLLGSDQITCVAESSAMGFDPETGKVLWNVSRPGSSEQAANCSQVTSISDNRVLLTKGYQLGGQLVELSRLDKRIAAKTVWENSRVLRTKIMSPVVLDGYAYSLSDGFLECVDIRDDGLKGKRVWIKRGGFGNGQLLRIGKYLLVHSEKGKAMRPSTLRLVEATPDEYRELGEIPTINGICWNTLCFQNGLLLVRSELEAACFELELAGGSQVSGSVEQETVEADSPEPIEKEDAVAGQQ